EAGRVRHRRVRGARTGAIPGRAARSRIAGRHRGADPAAPAGCRHRPAQPPGGDAVTRVGMMPDSTPQLLVDEDADGLQAQLKWAYEDFDVVLAGDRSSALAVLRAEEPAVVTLDLGLPPDPDGTSEGFALLDQIMALKSDIKVIVASGHGARDSALAAI